jgi:hypothetical protein
LAGEEYNTKEIADYLCIGPKTVERHRANIVNKSNLNNLADLTASAIEEGLVDRERSCRLTSVNNAAGKGKQSFKPKK